MTLIQGRGVRSPSPRIVTYSRPSSAKAAKAVKEFDVPVQATAHPDVCSSAVTAGAAAVHGACAVIERPALPTCPADSAGRPGRTAAAASALARESSSASQEINAAARAAGVGQEAQPAAAHERLQGALQILLVGRRLFIQDDHVGG